MKKIVVKKVDEEPTVIEKDDVTLEDMQEMVDGLIECIHVGGKVDLWINDMGKLLDLPLNFVLTDEDGNLLDTIQGDVFFASSDDCGELVGLSDAEIVWITNKLSCDYGLVAEFNERHEGVLHIVPMWLFDPTVS